MAGKYLGVSVSYQHCWMIVKKPVKSLATTIVIVDEHVVSSPLTPE